MSRFASTRRLDEIRRLDPVRDHQRIVHLIACYEFPWDFTRSLELALFRTFCVPRISRLLDHTGEFRLRSQKRYDDTDIIVSEMVEWGYDSDRGRAAIRRMNQLHRRFEIANEDYLYVLSTFIYVPIRWIQRFGWRPLCAQERLGLFHFWRQVGLRMGIRQIPDDAHAFEQFSDAFEKRHFHYHETNQRVAQSVMQMFAGWFPLPLRPTARASMRALMDDAMIQGFGLPSPSPITRALVTGGLRLRGNLLRWLPKRTRPRLRTQGKHPSYPQGYHLSHLGPPPGTCGEA